MQAKVTLSLDAELLERVRKVVQAGNAKSQSAFFEDALRAKLRQIEWEAWRREMEEAGKDPLFLADIEEVERDFMHADAEAMRMAE